MNKLQAVISSLKKDMNNIDIDKIIHLYSEELPVADIASALGRNSYEINKVLYALQLRRKKKHRAEDYRLYLLQLGDETDTYKTVSSIQNELDNAYDTIGVYESKLQKLALDNKALKARSKKWAIANRDTDVILEAIRSQTIEKSLVSKLVVEHPETNDGLIVMYGDTHYGELVNKNEVPSNEYNYEIAKQRVDRLLDAILLHPKQSKNVIVVDLKDTIKGVIHGGINNTEGGFIQSIMEAVKINVYFLGVLSQVYDKVKVYSTGSNHERLQDYIVSDGKYLDYGRLIDTMVSEHLRAIKCSNVVIHTTDTGNHIFNVNGATVLATHGDAYRSYKPYDASQRALLQDACISLYGTTYRHCINGHGHQFIACHNQYRGMSIQNGTLVGCNSYGVQNGMRDVPATQSIAFVEEDGSIQTVTAVDLN